MIYRINCEFDIVYRFTCSVCGRVAEDSWRIVPHAESLDPSVPNGWNSINGKAICGDHEVKIENAILVDKRLHWWQWNAQTCRWDLVPATVAQINQTP